MKRITQILILVSLFLFSDCRREKSWIIKGRLLESCDNPIPVSGRLLYISSSKSISNPVVQTDDEGRFSLPYELDYRQIEFIKLRDENKIYLVGIPKKENIVVGDLYSKDNFFALLKLQVNRATSVEDTIYYDYLGYRGAMRNYRKFKVGPFTDGQVIDSVVFFDQDVYDSVLYNLGNFSRYIYKIGYHGKDLAGVGTEKHLKACHKHNVYQLRID